MKGSSHYFDQDPKAGHDFQDIQAEFEGRTFLFRTDKAVFSRARVDPGTDLLLETVLSREEDRPLHALDLGTGVGIMALVLAGLRPSFRLTGLDINKRALELAAFNARRAGLAARIEFEESDGVPGGKTYDLVLSNPPIRAGKATVYRLFQEVAASLALEGAFYLVVRVKQGAASSKRELERHFDRVETLARAKGYHVIRARGPKEGKSRA